MMLRARSSKQRTNSALFKDAHHIVSDDAEASGLLERASTLQGDVDDAKADLTQAEQRHENVRSQPRPAE